MESFTSAFQVKQKVPQIDADIGFVFVKAEFLTYFVTDDIVTFLLNEFSDILAFKSESIKTAISDLPIGESFLLQIGNELGMAFFKYNFGRAQELFTVFHQHIDFLL